MSLTRTLRPLIPSWALLHPRILPPFQPCRALQTAALQYPYKDSQDRESLKPRPSMEESQSASADEIAEKQVSWDGNVTDPDLERSAAALESGGNPGYCNPLDLSAADREWGGTMTSEDAADKSDKKIRSRHEKGKKHGKVAPLPDKKASIKGALPKRE
ncbi:uncharacterized protein CTHT_0041310 [Thermochaetoides thermophila DSM 1495]|uniref:Uncharacterized protein n=1 Tax=Chaetomium thermophilum (strain DSM 1495 / CBS 144.50 / IMI 039719) TaxID=759272 RepID=G0SA80_CHATD|nr:hypothetical protein CTHT_0041310 [Thermochaetoides thermophila DSM 1495]EGS19652.1 hypothetical protein CTHT_0041310 [Thermochaetoides thermophila DSM 1495]